MRPLREVLWKAGISNHFLWVLLMELTGPAPGGLLSDGGSLKKQCHYCFRNPGGIREAGMGRAGPVRARSQLQLCGQGLTLSQMPALLRGPFYPRLSPIALQSCVEGWAWFQGPGFLRAIPGSSAWCLWALGWPLYSVRGACVQHITVWPL